MFSKAKLSIQKGASFVDKYKLLLLAAYTSRKGLKGLLKPLINLFTNNGRIPVILNDVNWNGSLKIFIRENHFDSDYLSFSELLLFNCYQLPIDISPDIIVDGGGNTGIFTLMANRIYPSVTVLLFEPVKDNILIIQEHLRENDAKCIVHKGILTRKSGTIPFYIRNANNSSEDPGLPYNEVINIDSFSLSEILNRTDFNSALIKLDIEGSEVEVIPDLLSAFKGKRLIIVGELHNWPHHLESLRTTVALNNYNMAVHDQDQHCLLFKIYKD